MYTDSAPVCPWLTSRPPRKLGTKGKSGRNEEILMGSVAETTSAVRGRSDRTNQLVYLYRAASKREGTTRVSGTTTEHRCHRSETPGVRQSPPQPRAPALASSRGSLPAPGRRPRHRPGHIPRGAPCIYRQVFAQPQNCRKGHFFSLGSSDFF